MKYCEYNPRGLCKILWIYRLLEHSVVSFVYYYRAGLVGYTIHGQTSANRGGFVDHLSET
jgi:hypothetical protein